MARSATPGRKLVPQRARRQEQALARARDHLIRRRQMLELVVDDWHHALGDRLVLQVDAVDLRVDLVSLLSRAIQAPVIALIVLHASPAEPVGGVGKHLVAAAGAADWSAVFEGWL